MNIEIKEDHPLYNLLNFIDRKDNSIKTLEEQVNVLEHHVQGLTDQIKSDLEASTETLIDRMIIAGEYAMHLGIPYVFGAEYHNNKSFDCSSFVESLYAFIGIDIPRVSRYQAKAGNAIEGDLKRGDLLFFDTNRSGTINHVGMYIGEGKMLHTNNPNSNINIVVIADDYEKWFVTARRIISIS